VPVCGAMDTYSHRLANRMVGNTDEDATLEVTLLGPTITFEASGEFAVTGATFALSLDGVPVSMNARIDARPGSCLKFAARSRGARSYMAFAGGVQVPMILNSRSTHVLTRMGGYDGRPLRAGDRLETGPRRHEHRASKGQPLPLPTEGARLRVVAGPAMGQVAGVRFRVSTNADRMGYRLEGKVTGDAQHGELVSKPVPTGTVQITPGGEPILLMADHATSGGYQIAAVVITADLPLAAQLAPGDWIEFVPCSVDEADEAARQRESALDGTTP